MTRNSVTLTLPVPSNVLGKNQGHNHWSVYHKAFQEHKEWARLAAISAYRGVGEAWTGPVWVRIDWHSRKPFPDLDNAIMRCAAYADGVQAAEVFVNDRQVRGFRVEFAPDYRQPHVDMTFELDGS